MLHPRFFGNPMLHSWFPSRSYRGKNIHNYLIVLLIAVFFKSWMRFQESERIFDGKCNGWLYIAGESRQRNERNCSHQHSRWIVHAQLLNDAQVLERRGENQRSDPAGSLVPHRVRILILTREEFVICFRILYTLLFDGSMNNCSQVADGFHEGSFWRVWVQAN